MNDAAVSVTVLVLMARGIFARTDNDGRTATLASQCAVDPDPKLAAPTRDPDARDSLGNSGRLDCGLGYPPKTCLESSQVIYPDDEGSARVR
jgi:hypothetical protein